MFVLRACSERHHLFPASPASGHLQGRALRLLIIEVKAVERLLAIHQAQVLTYLTLGGYKIGLLMNFNTVRLKDGLRRFVL
jgi:PD-(D/E)XK nuclease superfamily